MPLRLGELTRLVVPAAMCCVPVRVDLGKGDERITMIKRRWALLLSAVPGECSWKMVAGVY